MNAGEYFLRKVAVKSTEKLQWRNQQEGLGYYIILEIGNLFVYCLELSGAEKDIDSIEQNKI